MDTEILDSYALNPSVPRQQDANTSNTFDTQEILSVKRAVEFLLEGTLKQKVCRFCLSITSPLLELDQILHIGGRGSLFKVTIQDMIASFHPFKIVKDPNLPNKICDECVTCTINAYLFSQQCERSERAIRNCLDDIFDKLSKLDPLGKVKRRGRQKRNPNFNKILVEHKDVIDYAEPIIHIINRGASNFEEDKEIKINKFECLKCWQVLPNIECLLNHEKIHPKSMWYNCRYCGKSFPKVNQIKRHIQYEHIKKSYSSQVQSKQNANVFTCQNCFTTTNSLNAHLEHIEKHNFKTVLKHLVEKNMDHLCTICLNKEMNMVDLDKRICFHGGYPDLNGDRTLYNILSYTQPEMCYLQNYTGTKICEKCLDQAITSYVFVHRSRYIRNRLKNCITLMLQKLSQKYESDNNLIIEISQNIILAIKDEDSVCDLSLLNEDSEFDESKLKIDVLEDEFRIDLENDSDSEEDIRNNKTLLHEKAENMSNYKSLLHKDGMKNNLKQSNLTINKDCKTIFTKKIIWYDGNIIRASNLYTNMTLVTPKTIEINKIKKKEILPLLKNAIDGMSNETYYNPARNVTKTYIKRKVVNGCQKNLELQNKNANDICSEFLTFKKRKKPVKRMFKLTCPYCCKSFISGYYLKIHVLKHLNKKVTCDKCGLMFKSKFFLHEHNKIVHLLNQTNFSSCKICSRIFRDANRMKLHVRNHNIKRCQLCEKTFISQKHCDSHMQRHVNKYNMMKQRNVHNCSFCEKEFTDKSRLLLHVNKVHLQIKPFNCVMCEKQFYTQTILKEHVKTHSIPSKEVCQLCDKTFKCRKKLVIHIRKHLRMKPYHCKICEISFYSEYGIKKHFCRHKI